MNENVATKTFESSNSLPMTSTTSISPWFILVLKFCGSRRNNFCLHVTWGLIYTLSGAIQLIAGIYFMLNLPIFEVGSNIWTGVWNLLCGFTTLCLCLHSSRHKSNVQLAQGLLLLSLVITIVNLVNLLICEVGEWRSFLTMEDKVRVEQESLKELMYSAYLTTTVTTILVMIVSFLASQHSFLFFLQLQSSQTLFSRKIPFSKDSVGHRGRGGEELNLKTPYSCPLSHTLSWNSQYYVQKSSGFGTQSSNGNDEGKKGSRIRRHASLLLPPSLSTYGFETTVPIVSLKRSLTSISSSHHTLSSFKGKENYSSFCEFQAGPSFDLPPVGNRSLSEKVWNQRNGNTRHLLGEENEKRSNENICYQAMESLALSDPNKTLENFSFGRSFIQSSTIRSSDKFKDVDYVEEEKDSVYDVPKRSCATVKKSNSRVSSSNGCLRLCVESSPRNISELSVKSRETQTDLKYTQLFKKQSFVPPKPARKHRPKSEFLRVDRSVSPDNSSTSGYSSPSAVGLQSEGEDITLITIIPSLSHKMKRELPKIQGSIPNKRMLPETIRKIPSSLYSEQTSGTMNSSSSEIVKEHLQRLVALITPKIDEDINSFSSSSFSTAATIDYLTQLEFVARKLKTHYFNQKNTGGNGVKKEETDC